MPTLDVYALRRKLKEYDTRLEFEWSNKLNAYAVWAKDLRGHVHIIATIPLGQLDALGPHILEAIDNVNVVRYGADEINRRIDARIARDELADEVRLHQELDHLAAEGYDYGMRVEKSRVNNVGIPQVSPSETDGGATIKERDMNGH